MCRILIHGAGFTNKGAESLTCTTVKELSRRIRGARILMSVLGRQIAPPDVVHEDIIRVDSLSVHILEKLSHMLSCPSLFDRGICRHKAVIEMRRVGRVAAIVDISGFAISDAWGPLPALLRLQLLRQALKSRTPYVFLPQAWGPFENKGVASIAKEICEKATLVFARDEESKKHVLKLMGQDFPCRLAPDIAFRFEAGANEQAREVLAHHGITDINCYLIGIVPNIHVYRRAESVCLKNAYMHSIEDVVEYCTRVLDARIVVIPHDISASGDSEDYQLCKRIGIGAPRKVTVLTGRYPATVLKSVIGQCDFLIGSRYHALIAGLSQGVPAMAIGWSHKYSSLMRSVGMSEYAINHYELERARCVELVQKAIHDLSRYRQQLRTRVEEIRGQVDTLFDQVAELIQRTT